MTRDLVCLLSIVYFRINLPRERSYDSAHASGSSSAPVSTRAAHRFIAAGTLRNRADFEEIQRRESIASKLAAKQAPPAALTNLLLQEKKQAKTEERESGQQATKRTLAELMKGAGGSGDAGE